MPEKVTLVRIPERGADGLGEEFIIGFAEALKLDSMIILGVGDHEGDKATFCAGWTTDKHAAIMIDDFLRENPNVTVMLTVLMMGRKLRGGPR